MRYFSFASQRSLRMRGRRNARRVLIFALAASFAWLGSASAFESLFSDVPCFEPSRGAGVFSGYLSDASDVAVDLFAENDRLWTDGFEIEPLGDPAEEADVFELSPEKFAAVDLLAPTSIYDSKELCEGFEERAEKENSNLAYNGNSFTASQDVVVRGSVNLPTLKTIQFWGNGYVGSGHVSPVGWNGRVKENNSGAAVGLNIPFGIATLSAYYNYHRNRSGFFQRKIQQEDDGIGMALYANVGGFYMTGLALYGDDGYTAYDTTGNIKHTFIGGYQSTGFFETGYEMPTLGMFVLKPFGSYQYTNLKHGNFSTSTLHQYSGKRKYNSCLMTLGSRVDLNLAGMDVFTLEGRMAWITQLRKRNESIQSFCYGRVPGTMGLAQPYFHGRGAGSDFFWGGVGLRLSLMGTLSISADYDCLVNKYQTLNEGSIGLLFGF